MELPTAGFIIKAAVLFWATTKVLDIATAWTITAVLL